MYIKRTQICVAELDWIWDSLTITINNFDAQEIHRCRNTYTRDELKKYIIWEIRKDKRLYNKYRML
jgi:hypothetical protein